MVSKLNKILSMAEPKYLFNENCVKEGKNAICKISEQ